MHAIISTGAPVILGDICMAGSEGVRHRQPGQQNRPTASPSDSKTESEQLDEKKTSQQLFTPKDQLHNLIALGVVTALAFFTRFYKIYEPDQVVFDEVHFGKFASYYIRGTYFFDVHPPLAKMMLGAIGYIIGYDGHFLFDNIGDSYITNNVPYIGMRALPAFLGAVTVPIVYQTMREAGFPVITCSIAGLLLVFDNMLVTQSRLILLDAMLLFYMVCSMYSYVRFYKTRHNAFSTQWWVWLLATGVSIGMTTSVKMVGLFTVATVGVAVLFDLWELMDIRRGLSMDQFMRHFFARALGLIVVPFLVYLFWFYVHFATLPLSGPGDDFMSTEFQETLRGNTMVDGLFIKFGDNITMRHKDTSMYLHSHPHNYPLRYDDGRISSAGQQVTGYVHKDPNNVWQVVHNDVLNPNIGRQVKDKDVIRLLHVGTGSYLLAHDVASPTMNTNEEITTHYPVEGDSSRFNDTLFQIQIDSGGDKLRTMASTFKLIHVPTKVAVWTFAGKLPEWGFEQQEVNGNKNLLQKSNLWVADSIEGKSVEAEMAEEAKKPVKTRMFILKYLELQGKMISHNAGLTASHPYQSQPLEWPLLNRGISFWTENETRKQIYLLGNPVGMALSLVALASMGGVMVADTLSRRRGFHPINEDVHKRLYSATGFFFLAWVLHYLPFFLMGRALFLHHYMPGLIFGYMVLAALHGFMFVEGVDSPVSESGPATRPRKIQRSVVTTLAYATGAILIAVHVAGFLYYAPLAYGTSPVSVEGLKQRQLNSKWDFHFAK